MSVSFNSFPYKKENFALKGIILAAIGTFAILTNMCEAQAFRARDLQGIRLDMTPEEVEQLTHAHLTPLGRGDFKLEFNKTEFDLGFSPLGHLYRIDSDQQLGSFAPDLPFAATLTSKLTEKFGPPRGNMLPGGPINWELQGMVTDNNGTNPRELESLSAMLEGGYGTPIHLVMKMLDFRVLWRDQASVNATPRNKAAEATRF
jgi:hypothetical protein